MFACASCRVGFDLVVHDETDVGVLRGFLRCPRCAIVVPVLDGLVMFTEVLLHEGQATAAALAAMAFRLFGSDASFTDYRREKMQRGVMESYAAFAPFNESMRSVEPLLPHAAATLRDRDAILDTWCRTGYSGEWLAGRFPRQQVVSLWEGNSSVLGYRGFRHLLGPGRRAGNLDIVFCDLDKPLPFRDGAFGLVHAYDSLHRYDLTPFAGECLRVARADAAILFPHLHLSNSEPQPFFERGCQQRHGRDYRAWLDRVTAVGERRGWVFSEAALFNGPELAALIDDYDTTHYNGMVAILPQPSQPVTPLAFNRAAQRLVVSPLFRIHLGRTSVRVAPGLFDSAVGHLLERHPVYQARLPDEAVNISEPALLALLLAVVGHSEHDIDAAISPASSVMTVALQALVDVELLRPALLSDAGHRLQRFHGNQLPVRDGGVLEGFWSTIAGCDHDLLNLGEGDSLSGRDLCGFIASLDTLLRGKGLHAGDWLSIAAGSHPLLLLAAIAATSLGFNVRLLSFATAAHPDTKLLLQGDGEAASSGMTALPLGLDGETSSLLALLDSAEPQDAAAGIDDTGLVEFELAAGMACCRLAELVDALESLSGQIDRQLWLLEGRSPLSDLLACLAGWSSAEAVRALSSDSLV